MSIIRRHPTIERFFCSPSAVSNARSYIGIRKDADAFRAELSFHIEGPTLVARFCETEIRLAAGGTGVVLLPTGGVFGFTSIDQPIAYLMARFW